MEEGLGTFIGTVLGTSVVVVGIAAKVIKDAVGNQVHKEVSKEFKKALDDDPEDKDPEKAPGMRQLVMEVSKKQGEVSAQVGELSAIMANEVEIRKDWQAETRKRFDRIEADNTKRFDTVDKCVKEMTDKVNHHGEDIARLQERERIRSGNGGS